ncbi:hypothetical protein S40293_10202 [Stachybotrys chartarum IBT 40293]|nr:hypothetical protein S40293_10202 [Stachybotrys chartarum IBT 40293]
MATMPPQQPALLNSADDCINVMIDNCRRTNIAINEKIVAFTGKSKLKLTIKTKPTPTGFKVWVVAQKGYFLGWVGHRPQQKYGPASKPPKALKGAFEKPALNPIQSVVPFLVKLLPASSYHVFLDNLFSSLQLFLELRHEGHGATGIARSNCGIYKGLVDIKVRDKAGKFYTGMEFEACIRRRPMSKIATSKPVRAAFGSEAVKEMKIPSIMVTYNHEMGAVDIGD